MRIIDTRLRPNKDPSLGTIDVGPWFTGRQYMLIPTNNGTLTAPAPKYAVLRRFDAYADLTMLLRFQQGLTLFNNIAWLKRKFYQFVSYFSEVLRSHISRLTNGSLLLRAKKR